jgi:aminopeptidase-like protein
MKIDDIARQDFSELGLEMYQFVSDLYPICRSITGNGLRETIRRVKQHIPLEMREAATGERVFDWTIPKEWNIRNAYVKNSKGEKIIDFQRSNLHILNYSTPIHAKMSLAELRSHLFSNPEHPDWIPYRTSYYKESWGFCISDKQRVSLEEDEYEVCIDSTLESGHLTYGEYSISGCTDEEVFISCHSCHPSLCNDNLSGIALATFLAKLLTPLSLRYSYRFLFAPGAIGAITWLARNESTAARIKHGLVVACVGDSGPLTYKKSRRGDAEIDRAVEHVFKHSGRPYEIREFSPYGYDERQYCSPGFNLPVGSLTRTPHGEFPQYHTSADNLEFVRAESLGDSLSAYINIIRLLEQNKKYVNQNAKCEPQLGKRGIYRAMGGQLDQPLNELAMLWVLNLSDGAYSLLDIATRSGLPFETIQQATDVLVTHGLLKECDEL